MSKCVVINRIPDMKLAEVVNFHNTQDAIAAGARDCDIHVPLQDVMDNIEGMLLSIQKGTITVEVALALVRGEEETVKAVEEAIKAATVEVLDLNEVAGMDALASGGKL